jgi:membrane protein DedA with SNARE-associated domain
VLNEWIGPAWPYLVVLVAAAVEGEVAYIGAATLVAAGQLNAVAVCLSGAVGAAIGDQAYFYLCRGRLQSWLQRYPAVRAKAAPLVDRVRRHDWLMVLLIRFAPGLRIAIAVACAWADVPPRRFTLLNLLSAIVWAAALMLLVGWLGPTYLATFGLKGWQAAALTGGLLIGLFVLLGMLERRAMERGDANRHASAVT